MSDWTTSEIRRLREMYAHTSLKLVVAALPRHSIGAIRARAWELRLTRPHRDWRRVAAEHKFSLDLGQRTA